ncbi:MAG: RelA/SpoT family protein [Tannerella sp.]|jgi:GTP pyrophosphokinase|nr:RelA/SpoT family protein [Tannerella sp.]
MEKEALTLEDQRVQEEFNLLLDDYMHSNHRKKIERITEAFLFAKMAHSTSPKRKSGEPYIMHPLAVARIVCNEMGLGSTSICSALLHDVVEDTGYNVDDINSFFGPKIAEIVDGLTKITFYEKNAEQQAELEAGKGAESKDKAKEHTKQAGEQDLMHFANLTMQAASIRKLLVTMSSDIRVVLIKLADRLHNLRTLASMKLTSQFRTIGETMFLYAPLANRLGLHAIKTELEDLCFKYEHPQEYENIRRKLKARERLHQRLFQNFAEPVNEKLRTMGFTFEMRNRVKSIYSIWEKMESKDIPFEEVFDIFAVRIIFESKEEVDDVAVCWQIYAAITNTYRPHPERTRDWVGHPKANGYQSLHLTVMGPDGVWIEIQIRSRRMDEVAEKGVAAHWKYKEHGEIEEETELSKWLHTISEILEHPAPNTLDFLDTIKMNLFASEIYVFTPKGDTITLPKNATALDFAYELHTNIGNNCIGAKVNRRLVPLSHPLTNGDQVEILTSRSQQLQPEWLGFVVTAKARTKIEAILKRERKETSKKGELLLIEAFHQAGIEPISSYMDKVAVYYGFPKREELCYALAKGSVATPDNIKSILKDKTDNVLFRYVKDILHVGPKNKETQKPLADKINHEINRNEPYQLMGNEFGRNYEVAPCCKPIQGDEVLGFVNDDNTVIVHKRSCQVAIRLKTSFKDRILSTLWCSHTNFTFEATLGIKGIDTIGVLSAIATTISEDFNVNIKQVLIETNDGVFEGKIKMLVHNVDDVRKMCVALSEIKSIRSVVRIAD